MCTGDVGSGSTNFILNLLVLVMKGLLICQVSVQNLCVNYVISLLLSYVKCSMPHLKLVTFLTLVKLLASPQYVEVNATKRISPIIKQLMYYMIMLRS